MREDDSNERVYYRSERVFSVHNQWWFATREGENQGPFSTRERAKVGLQRYVLKMQGLKARETDDELSPRVLTVTQRR